MNKNKNQIKWTYPIGRGTAGMCKKVQNEEVIYMCMDVIGEK
jgi:hypothetical protein